MQHFWSLEAVSLQNAWLTIGSFDGVHRGHQKIISQLTAEAHSQAAPAVVVTFYPHPSLVLRGQSGPFYLTTPDERARLLGELGVDVVVTHPFNAGLAATSARGFMQLLKERLGLRQLWAGNNFALGRGREGDVSALRQLGQELDFTLQLISPMELDGQPVSSTRIRTLLQEGEVVQAAHLLGRSYRLAGEIVSGDARGRTIGFPTANLQTWPEQIMPAAGVYACRAWLEGKPWAAATNIGVRPTFAGDPASPHIEAHLLDFSGDLYGKLIQLEFVARLRGEQKFPAVDALIAQIRQDVARTREMVSP